MGLNTYKVFLIRNYVCTHVISNASLFRSKFAKEIMKHNTQIHHMKQYVNHLKSDQSNSYEVCNKKLFYKSLSWS